MSAERWFRRLLRVLPGDFRADYGAEMTRVFREQHREAGAAGRSGLVRLWAETIAALLAIGPREHLAQLRQDVIYAFRGMRRTPAFTAVAILTLALGIGANTAIFSVVHAVLLRPLPYAQPERLVAVWNRWDGRARAALSNPEYLDYAERTTTLQMAAASATGLTIAGFGEPERVNGLSVTPGTFDVLGRQPALGRAFRAEEGLPGRDHVIILSDAMWRRRFNADPSVVGRSLSVNGVPHEVIGVLPPDLALPVDIGSATRAQAVIPLSMDAAAPRTKRGGHYLWAVARLERGATLASAAAEMDNIIAGLVREYPEEHNQGGFGITVIPLDETLLGASRPVLLVLIGSVGLVLLLACANVANLLLARGESRRLELAVRSALGASRLRVARQLVTEACVLSLAGAAAGLIAASWAERAIVTLAADSLPRLDATRFSAPVLLFTLVLALATGVAFGLAPALHAPARLEALKEGSRGGAGGRARIRRALTIAQVAIAVVLLVGAGLLMKSFQRVVRVPSGIEPDRVLTLRVSLPEARYPGRTEIAAFFSRYLEQLRTRPGVLAAGAGSGLPLSVASGDWNFDIEGRPRVNGRKPGAADWYVITPGYVEALGIRLARGRLPQESDTEAATPVIFINETTARVIFPGQDPIGRRVRLAQTTGPEQPWRTIAGVLTDVRTRGLDTPPRTEMFIPYRQFVHFSAGVQARSMTVVVKTSSVPGLVAADARAALHALDPGIPAADLREMNAVLSTSVADRRLNALLVGSFAALALVIAAIGVYGVIAYAVAQRWREIGVRVAIGASRGSVLSLLVGQGLRLVGTGILLGLMGALALGGTLADLLYDATPYDAAVFATVAGLLFLVGAAASYFPARRALSVDPLVALRE